MKLLIALLLLAPVPFLALNKEPRACPDKIVDPLKKVVAKVAEADLKMVSLLANTRCCGVVPSTLYLTIINNPNPNFNNVKVALTYGASVYPQVSGFGWFGTTAVTNKGNTRAYLFVLAEATNGNGYITAIGGVYKLTEDDIANGIKGQVGCFTLTVYAGSTLACFNDVVDFVGDVTCSPFGSADLVTFPNQSTTCFPMKYMHVSLAE